jgi:hypothetical protein
LGRRQVADAPPALGLDDERQQFLLLARALRDAGATRVRDGAFEVAFGPAAPPSASQVTPDPRVERARAYLEEQEGELA